MSASLNYATYSKTELQAELMAMESRKRDTGYAEWIPQHLRIRTKTDGLQSLAYNPIQQKLNEIFDRQKAERGQVHMLIGKARQMGWTPRSRSRSPTSTPGAHALYRFSTFQNWRNGKTPM